MMVTSIIIRKYSPISPVVIADGGKNPMMNENMQAIKPTPAIIRIPGLPPGIR